MKTCSKCRQEKELDAFCFDKKARDGRGYKCKLCYCIDARERRRQNPAKEQARSKIWRQNNYERARTREKAWRRTNLRRIWECKLLREYSLTLAEYDALVCAQLGRCAICNVIPDRGDLDLDHCHKTGRVRGLLCQHCNIGLGHFDDRPELVAKASRYLTGAF